MNWLGETMTVTNALAYYTFLQVATVISFYKTDPKCFFIQSLIVKEKQLHWYKLTTVRSVNKTDPKCFCFHTIINY